MNNTIQSVCSRTFNRVVESIITTVKSCRGVVFLGMMALSGSGQLWSESLFYYVHSDHRGAPVVVTDEQQTVVWQAGYRPFGEAELVVNAVDFPLRLPGQYVDQESGLYYNYFRDYDSRLGRYIQSDPIGLRGGLNTYGYALQNPMMYIDPDGLNPWIGRWVLKKVWDGCKWAYKKVWKNDKKKPDDKKSGNQRGNPYEGEPNTWKEHPHGKQDRLYGNDGKPSVDIDYGHDHGQGSPHAHNWQNGKRGPGVPVSPLDK